MNSYTASCGLAGYTIYVFLVCVQCTTTYVKVSGKLIVSRYIAESITTDAGRFSHVDLCQLRTKLKVQQCETSYKQTLTNGAM